jgi:uncharacterized FlaG/YvyC family protein
VKKRHIQTNFIKFIIEKYSNDQEPQIDIEDEAENPEEETEETEKPQLKKVVTDAKKKMKTLKTHWMMTLLMNSYKSIKK